MTFTVALMIAVSYWGARDVRTPCHPVPVRLSGAQTAAIDRLDGADTYMATYVRDCRILLSPDAAADRHWTPWLYCQGIVHEVGHIDGLEHSYGGVMNGHAFAGHVPWGCRHPGKWLRRHGFRHARHHRHRHR